MDLAWIVLYRGMALRSIQAVEWAGRGGKGTQNCSVYTVYTQNCNNWCCYKIVVFLGILTKLYV